MLEKDKSSDSSLEREFVQSQPSPELELQSCPGNCEWQVKYEQLVIQEKIMREGLEKQIVAMNTERHVLEQKVKYLTRHISIIQGEAKSFTRNEGSTKNSPQTEKRQNGNKSSSSGNSDNSRSVISFKNQSEQKPKDSKELMLLNPIQQQKSFTQSENSLPTSINGSRVSNNEFAVSNQTEKDLNMAKVTIKLDRLAVAETGQNPGQGLGLIGNQRHNRSEVLVSPFHRNQGKDDPLGKPAERLSGTARTKVREEAQDENATDDDDYDLQVEDEGISEVSNRMEHHNEAGSASQQRLFPMPASPAHSHQQFFGRKQYLGVQSDIVAQRKVGFSQKASNQTNQFSPEKGVTNFLVTQGSEVYRCESPPAKAQKLRDMRLGSPSRPFPSSSSTTNLPVQGRSSLSFSSQKNLTSLSSASLHLQLAKAQNNQIQEAAVEEEVNLKDTVAQFPTFSVPLKTPREDDDEEVKFEARFSTHPENHQNPDSHRDSNSPSKKRNDDRSQSVVLPINPIQIQPSSEHTGADQLTWTMKQEPVQLMQDDKLEDRNHETDQVPTFMSFEQHNKVNSTEKNYTIAVEDVQDSLLDEGDSKYGSPNLGQESRIQDEAILDRQPQSSSFLAAATKQSAQKRKGFQKLASQNYDEQHQKNIQCFNPTDTRAISEDQSDQQAFLPLPLKKKQNALGGKISNSSQPFSQNSGKSPNSGSIGNYGNEVANFTKSIVITNPHRFENPEQIRQERRSIGKINPFQCKRRRITSRRPVANKRQAFNDNMKKTKTQDPTDPSVIMEEESHIIHFEDNITAQHRNTLNKTLVNPQRYKQNFGDNNSIVVDNRATIKATPRNVAQMRPAFKREESPESESRPSVIPPDDEDLGKQKIMMKAKAQRGMLPDLQRDRVKTGNNMSRNNLSVNLGKNEMSVSMSSLHKNLQTPTKEKTRTMSDMLSPNQQSAFNTVVQKIGKAGKDFLDKITKSEPQVSNAVEDWIERQISVRRPASKNFFEKFLVIGPEASALEDLQKETSEMGPHTVRPTKLYQYPQEIDLESISLGEEAKSQYDDDGLLSPEILNSLGDFCFPNDIPVVKIDYDKSKGVFDQSEYVQQQIQDILYQKIISLRENMFVFTLDAQSSIVEKSGLLSEAKSQLNMLGELHLYCMCVWFTDLAECNGELYAVQKSMCLITVNQQYFGLLQNLLDVSLNMMKDARNVQHQTELELSDKMFSPEIDACLKVNIEDQSQGNILAINKLLEQVHTLRFDSLDFAGKSFQFGGSDSTLRYEFDIAKKVLFSEYQFHCSILFSLFDQSTLMKLLTALLLERSIVFVHDNLSIISSVILGFKLLLRPFQWCYMLAPILPNSLLENLEVPQPILVGITRTAYDQLEDFWDQEQEDNDIIDKIEFQQTEEFKNKTWVFLDCKDQQVNWGDEEAYDFDDKMKLSGPGVMDWCATFKRKTKKAFTDFKQATFDDVNSLRQRSSEYHKRNTEDRITTNSVFEGQNQRVPESALLPMRRCSSGFAAEIANIDQTHQTAAVLVPNEQQQNIIENIVKELQDAYKTQILDMISLICEHFLKQGVSEVELDVEKVAEELPYIIQKNQKKRANDRQKNFSQIQRLTTSEKKMAREDEKSVSFLQKFVFTQIFQAYMESPNC